MQLQSELLLEFLFSRDWLLEVGVRPIGDDRKREIERMARGMVLAGSIDHPSLQMGSDVLALRAVNRGARWFYLTPDQQHLEQWKKSQRVFRLPDRWLESMQNFRGKLHRLFILNCVGSCRFLRDYLKTMKRKAARREALKMLAIKNRMDPHYEIANSL